MREAVLVGDALASLSISLVRDYKREILDVLANTCLMLSDGEYMDVEMSSSGLSERDYLEKVRKKSAALFKAAAACGGLAGDGSAFEVECLARFGEDYGIAFQIKDDIADIASLENFEESQVPSDLREFKATLPIVHLYETAGTEVQELLEKLMSSKKKSYAEKHLFLSELLGNLGNSGSLLYCDGKADFYINLAIASLSGLKDSVFKSHLIQMAQALKLRCPAY